MIVFNANGIPSFLPLTAVAEIIFPSLPIPNYSKLGPQEAVLSALEYLRAGTATDFYVHIRRYGELEGKLRSFPGTVAALARQKKVDEEKVTEESGRVICHKQKFDEPRTK